MGKRRVLAEMMGAPVEEAKLRTDVKKIFDELGKAGDLYMDKLDELFRALDRVVTKKTGNYNPDPEIKKLRDSKYAIWNKAIAPYETRIEKAVTRVEKMPDRE
jgi:hypothetical protein